MVNPGGVVRLISFHWRLQKLLLPCEPDRGVCVLVVMDTLFSKLIAALVIVLLALPNGICCGTTVTSPRDGKFEIVALDQPGSAGSLTGGRSRKGCCKHKLGTAAGSSYDAGKSPASKSPISTTSPCHTPAESPGQLGCCCEVRAAVASPSSPSTDNAPVRFIGCEMLLHIDAADRQAITISRLLPLTAGPQTGPARQALLNVWRN